MKPPPPLSLTQRYGICVLGSILMVLAYLVLQPFLASIAWAVLLAYVSWPAYRWLRGRLGGRRNASALAAVALLAASILLPVLWLAALVKDDLVRLYDTGIGWLRAPQATAAALSARLPWLGGKLNGLLAQYFPEPQDLVRTLGRIALALLRWAIGWVGDIGWASLKTAVALVVLFFVYRDGEALGAQAARALGHLLGRRGEAYLEIARKMSRIIVQSTLLAAVLQGLVAGLGYWIVGAETPVLLGIATAIASLIPLVGTALVWVAVGALFIATGKPWQGIGIVAWGIVLVHPIDNIIRPALISSAAHVPFFFMLFGVLGGIAAFGLIGVFLGPMILALASAAWRDWTGAMAEGPGALDG